MDLKGKQFIDFILIPVIVIVVGVAAFGLGRLSALKEGESTIVIHPAGGTSQGTWKQ